MAERRPSPMAILGEAARAPEHSARRWRVHSPDWRQTALSVAAPAVVATAILSALSGWLFGTSPASPLAHALFVLVAGAIALPATGVIFGLLAGSFGGRASFERGFAAAVLAAIPGLAGHVLGTVPWVGPLLALVLVVYSLVLLYRLQPLLLDVPETRRMPHFVVSLVLLAVFWGLVSAPVAGLFMP